MTKYSVKGPNGLVFNLDEVTATGIVGNGNRGYEYVGKRPASKSSSKPAVKSTPASKSDDK